MRATSSSPHGYTTLSKTTEYPPPAADRQGRNNETRQMEEITRQEIEEALDWELWNEWYADLLLLVE